MSPGDVMKLILFHLVCALITNVSVANGQDHGADYRGKNLVIKNLVRNAIGKSVMVNFKTHETITGILIHANENEFIIEKDGDEERFQTETIRSFTIRPGISEGLFVFLTSVFSSGFGAGATTLSFDKVSSNVLLGVAVVFGFFGGWLGYESFFQEDEIVLP